MSGRKTFTAGEVLQAADVNDFLMDQSVMVFAGTAARSSAIPSPTEGMVTYRSDDDAVEVYDGSSWNAVGPGQILQVVSTTKTNIFTTTSLSLVDVTGLSVTITPSSTNSKVLILLGMMVSNSSAAQASQISLRRDATAIAVATTDQTAKVFTASTSSGGHFSLSHLDSPASTSALTYKVQVATAGGSTLGVGKYAASTTPSVSTITAMEVVG